MEGNAKFRQHGNFSIFIQNLLVICAIERFGTRQVVSRMWCIKISTFGTNRKLSGRQQKLTSVLRPLQRLVELAAKGKFEGVEVTKIAIVTGSTRPGRINDQVAKWVLEHTLPRAEAEFEIVDIADYELPLLDEPFPAGYQKYQNNHTKVFSSKIAEFDGYIFIVAEYNHSVTGALKNALDYLNVEFNNKAASFVSYGSKGGARAVEHLRGIASELQLAHVRNQVMFSIFSDVENFEIFKPAETSTSALDAMLDQLIPWTRAMEYVRNQALVVRAS